MTAQIIDGKAIAEEIRRQVTEEVRVLTEAGTRPHLVALEVGENPASRMYTRMQRRTCESVGIRYDLQTLGESSSAGDVLRAIEQISRDPGVTGMILQLPLPAPLDPRQMQQAIHPGKDVEGVHPANVGRLFYGLCEIAPCTSLAAFELIQRSCPYLGGKEAVVVGHSEIVGKPITAMLLASLDAAPTVTVCHVATRDLGAHTRQADLLIVATGRAQARWLAYQRQAKSGRRPAAPPDLSPLITAEMVKPGAVVIDVATNRLPRALDEDGRPVLDEKGKPDMVTVGDVDFEAVAEKASAITPVPGGVGPVTVAMLLRNTVHCTRNLAAGRLP